MIFIIRGQLLDVVAEIADCVGPDQNGFALYNPFGRGRFISWSNSTPENRSFGPASECHDISRQGFVRVTG